MYVNPYGLLTPARKRRGIEEELNMIQTHPTKLALPALLLAALVGCSTSPTMDGPGAPVTSVDDTSTGSYSAVEYFGANTDIAREGGVPEGDEFEEEGYYNDAGGATTDDLNAALNIRTIYFDYDSSEIRGDFRNAVIAHGMALASNPNLSITVEGHCDERGSREYNIALGERRANTLRRLLLAQGAMENQIVTISYGEERPAVLGSNEQAWARNRRAELIY